MYSASNYSCKSHRDVRAGRNDQPAVEHLRTNNEPDDCGLADAVAHFASRRCIGAQLRLFAEGDVASCYYLVESGKLLVHRRLAPSTSGEPVAAVRFLSRGDLFISNCGDKRAADCDALVDSVVLSINSVQLQRQTALDPELAHAQSAVHADELGWVLRSLRPNHGIMEIQRPYPEFGVAALPTDVLAAGSTSIGTPVAH